MSAAAQLWWGNFVKSWVVLVVSVIASSAYAQCTKDIECKGERICVKGVCETPSATRTPTTAPPPPPPQLANTQTEIIAKYVTGDAVGARDDAARSGFKELSDKLAALDVAYSAGVAAKEAGQVDTGIEQYETALRIDETITTESSKYARSIRKSLSKLYVQRADVQSSRGATADARSSLSKSLTYNASNADASSRLADLNRPTADQQRYSAKLVPREESFSANKVSLLTEKERLLASRPSIAGPIVGLVLAGAGVIAAAIGLATATTTFWVTFFAVFLAVDAVLVIVDIVVLGINTAARRRIDNRVKEIDAELQRTSFVPKPLGMVVLRF